MKNMITAIACTLLLMAFLVQFVHNQVVFQKLALVNATVEQWDAGLLDLQEKVGKIMDCDTSQVRVKRKDESIEVVVPIGQVLASPAFWGIDEAENWAEYVIYRGELDE